MRQTWRTQWRVTFSGIYSCSFTPYVVNFIWTCETALWFLISHVEDLQTTLTYLNKYPKVFWSHYHQQTMVVEWVLSVVGHRLARLYVKVNVHLVSPKIDSVLNRLDSINAGAVTILPNEVQKSIVANIYGDTGELMCKATLISGCAHAVVIVLSRACYYIDVAATLDVRNKVLGSEITALDEISCLIRDREHADCKVVMLYQLDWSKEAAYMMLPMRGNFHSLESTDAADLLNIGKRFQNDFGGEARTGVEAEARGI
ncbi:uncharacterized protein HD556DRAFT_1309386 [Suillus plorans]|uniref:Uncharacterized protein n=1 Tax=Suillus plorans TaxID=116603 RepID=A0A9P7DGB8_9AGAM|nr:uncharacterized protein HD556DRAFT_1309386 [Suillus plorans]KAG1792314.1 hypothetical protein HD556DRAFT_1309386 [Suillus plorans]